MSIGARNSFVLRAVGCACALAGGTPAAHARDLRAGTLHLAGATAFAYGQSTTTSSGEELRIRSLSVSAGLAAAFYLSPWFGVGPEVAFVTEQIRGADPSYAVLSAGLRAELDHALSEEFSAFGSASARLGKTWVNRQTPSSRDWQLTAGVKAFVSDACSLDLGVTRAGRLVRSDDRQGSTAEWRLGIGISLYVDLVPARQR